MVFCVIVAEVDTMQQFATAKDAGVEIYPGLFAVQQAVFSAS